MIPCTNPLAGYLARRAALDAAMRRVLERGTYILGEETRAFESEFAARIGAKHAIGVGSGTDALHIVLRACGIGPGDEVITTPFTAVATVAAIESAGAVPVFADIDPRTLTLSPGKAAAALTPRTRALVPVHLYGRPADMGPLLDLARGNGLRLIEDCAQAHGARYGDRPVGSLGDAGCFSFYPTKNLGAFGDGGAITTNDDALAERARRLREYGWDRNDPARSSEIPGLNSRLDELQAAILRVQLGALEAGNAARRRIAARYDAELAGLNMNLPSHPEGSLHAFHLYVVRSGRRDALRAFLRDRGIETGVHYPAPAHLQEAYKGLAEPGSLPEAERASREVLSLPMYPELNDEEVEAILAALRAFTLEAA